MWIRKDSVHIKPLFAAKIMTIIFIMCFFSHVKTFH